MFETAGENHVTSCLIEVLNKWSAYLGADLLKWHGLVSRTPETLIQMVGVCSVFQWLTKWPQSCFQPL